MKYEGDLTAEAGKVYEYTEITGRLEIPANVDVEFRNLTSIGGDASIEKGAKFSRPSRGRLTQAAASLPYTMPATDFLC